MTYALNIFKNMRFNKGRTEVALLESEKKAFEEAKALLEEKGFQVSDKSSKSLINTANKSRTSSVVLFGEKTDSNGDNKKREAKAAIKENDKFEQQSVGSRGTNNNSIISRSTNGRFEAKY